MLLFCVAGALFCQQMSGFPENIYAYEVLIDGEKYIAVPRQYRNARCVQISLARPWNVNDITSALVAGDGTIIEATRFAVRNDHEMSELIDCAGSALSGETRLLFERFRRITEGILFTTYATLRSSERQGKESRLKQILD